MSTDDQRHHDRVSINREFGSLDAFIAEYATDISPGGVFIRSKAPLPVGTRVDLRFTVLADEIESIEGLGEVVRVTDEGMGISFVQLTQSSQDVLRRLGVQAGVQLH